ncbi:MAG: CHASE2 domain-containing protein, partial [Alphaproteobacteria bacterium]|nr:CHASE2 domain-containing protein [Alphaproteobacteria bacterium]
MATAPAPASRHYRLLPLIVFGCAALAFWAGLLEPLDRNLMDARFRLLQRAPSGSLVIVEIDHRSVDELSSWPWPRSYHAQVLDSLFAAGARKVGVDIDFSSPSNAAADAALADSLGRHQGRVILPVFLQLETRRDGRPTVSETLPNPLFRDRVELGAVNVRPAVDSLVRQFPNADVFGHQLIPSLAARLADSADGPPADFYLDYGIRVGEVPRLSYVDILNGYFDPQTIQGKNVLIGATAVELGDQFAVPIGRVMPGPVLQALGYESVVQHRALRRTGAGVSSALAALVVLFLMLVSTGLDWRGRLVSLCGVWGGLYAVALAIGSSTAISLDLALPATAALLHCLFGFLLQFEQQARLLLQQRLADTRRRAVMRSVLEDSFDGILVVSADGIVEMANKAAGRLLERPPETMPGVAVTALLPVSLPSRPQLETEQSDAEEFTMAPLAPRELELHRQDGVALTLELAVSCSRVPLGGKSRNEERIFLTYTFRDVSERRRSEQSLRSAMQEALAANRAKTEFLANMSHELRTPLNAIIGFSDMIKDEVFGALPSSRYLDYATDINDCGKHLLDVINDILDMAKFESGEARLDEKIVNLGQVVDRSVRLAQGMRGAAALRFAVTIQPDLPPLRGDPRLIGQSVVNVLSNAVKFTAAGGTVAVAVERVAAGLCVRIADTGIGIPPDEIPRIVRPFYQVDSKLERAYEGTGLGLALVSACLQLHQGELTIESVFGEGTTVSLLFPAERIAAALMAALEA